jgi:hypothetical protein
MRSFAIPASSLQKFNAARRVQGEDSYLTPQWSTDTGRSTGFVLAF